MNKELLIKLSQKDTALWEWFLEPNPLGFLKPEPIDARAARRYLREAEVYKHDLKFKEAERSYRKALELDSGCNLYRYRLANFLAEQGRPKKWAKLWVEAAERMPARGLLFYRKQANFWADLEVPEEEIASLDRALNSPIEDGLPLIPGDLTTTTGAGIRRDLLEWRAEAVQRLELKKAEIKKTTPR